MENTDGTGTVTPAMVEARARELALIDVVILPNRPNLTINRPNAS